MNEKLKKILDALYRNPNDFQQACEKELCDPRIPDSSNFVSFLVNESTTIEYPYFYSIYKTFCQTTSGEMDAEVRKEIEELRKNTISIDVLKKECESLDDTTKNAFLNNLDIVAKNEKSLTVPIIAACLVTIATSENDKLDKFYEIATKLILAVAPSTKDASLDNSVIDNVLRQIEEHFDETIYNKTKAFLNSATIMNQLSATASTMETFCLTTKKDERMLRYYQNGEELPLITNESPLDPEPSIEDAIKTFDLNDNSNFLKYALEKIDDEVRKYFKDKGIDLKYAIPATEAVFLTLCHQLEKEVDDNVLFAISDPLSDMLNYSPFNEEILTAIKDICKEISGKEVELGESDKKSSDEAAPAEGLEHNHPENNTTTDSDEVTKPAGNPPVQNGPAQSLVKLPSKLAVAKLQKYAAEVLGTHGVFVGASGKAKYKNATPEQKNIIFQVNNAMLLPKKVKTITSKIVKNKTPSSYLDEDVDPSAEEIVSKLANVLAEIYSDHKSKLEKLRELQAKINKESNEDTRNKLKTKFESQKEAYRAATNKEGLMKELKRRINNEVFRTVKAFGDDYSDNYK